MNDTESRTLIATDLTSNLMVEAAAGTGKTTSIIGRMVNLIASGSCKIDTLAAATFTRKAAAELRERFHAKLRAESNSTERSDSEKLLLRDASNRIEHAFVGTFHSFCSLILRERPIECGVDPSFRELDESEDAYLREQAWQTFLKVLYSKEDNRLDRIYELGLNTDDLKGCYDRFVQFPDVDEWPNEAPNPIDMETIKSQAREYVDHMRAMIPSFPDERGNDQLMKRYEEIVRKTGNSDWRVDGQFFEVLELFDSKTVIKKTVQSKWIDKATGKRERDRFADFRTSLALPALQWWYRHRYEFVIQLLKQAQQIYAYARRESGGLGFQDLLLRSAEALKTQSSLRSYFQRRFSHILVDEFQDTDPIQAEILAYLTSEDNGETDWRKCIPVSGSLFLVGDPKQSIYRFRRADIVTYQQVKRIFEDSGGKIVTLSKNFRSTDVVRSWINPTFGSLQDYEESIYSPAAVNMEQGRTEQSTGEISGVEILSLPEGVRQKEAVAFESEQIAKYIADSIEKQITIPRTQQEIDQGKPESVQPGDFLIITKNKFHLGAYSEALDRYGIANEVSGSNAFKNINELKTILTCIQAIDDPRDPIPYVSLLRSELFGFGDADLYELKRNGGSFSYLAPIPEQLDADLLSRFQEVCNSLKRYRSWLRNMPFTTAFSKIASDLGLLAKCSSNRDGNIVAGGFLKAVEWLRAQSWDFDSANDVVSYLEEIISKSETDSCNVLPQSGTSVRIMNVHKAKGLEAPVVFLACASGRKDSRMPDFHVDRSGETTRGYLAITKPNGDWGAVSPVATPANWDHFQAEEKLFADGEDTRLLYVACTRAACKLVVTVANSGLEKSSFWKPLHDHVCSMDELKVNKPQQQSFKKLVSAPSMTLGELSSQLENSWSSLCKPTYVVVAAKAVAMKPSSRPTWRASGNYGAAWGSALHALLEIKMKLGDADLNSFARQLVEQFELGTDRVSELVSSANSVVASDIWARSKRASKLYSEIPFESFDSSAIPPTITRGVVDLCFEESDGWVIVDYKTDDISESELEVATKHYAPQLQTYAEFWNSNTGANVAEAGIYFTQLSIYQAVIF